MELKRISLSKVLKLEIPLLLNDVIKIIEKHNPEHLHLNARLNALKEQQQLVKLLEVPRIAHPLTAKVQLLREKELQCVGAIVSHMQFIVRADIESMRDAVSVAQPIVMRFLSGLRKNNERVIDEIIHQFSKYLDQHSEVYDALSNLGLQPFVDEMRKVHAQKHVVMMERENDNLNRESKVNSRLIQKEAMNVLNSMFDTIVVLSGYKDSPNYDPLIQELNVLLTRYATIIHTRKTHNKKKSTTIIKKTNQDETTPILLPNLIEALKLRNLDKT